MHRVLTTINDNEVKKFLIWGSLNFLDNDYSCLQDVAGMMMNGLVWRSGNNHSKRQKTQFQIIEKTSGNHFNIFPKKS